MKDLRYWHPGATRSAGRAYTFGARPGSGNIGEAVAERLALDRWDVVMDDGATGDGSRPRGGNLPDDETAERFGYNITDKGRYQQFREPSVDEFRRRDPDALIVSVGTTAKTSFPDLYNWDIDNLLRANLLLPLRAALHYVKATAEHELNPHANPRWIIFIGSYGHDHPFTAGTPYCAAKAGLNMAARTLAWELTDRGYRVACINPWHVADSPMWEETQRHVEEARGWTRAEADAYAFREQKMPRRLSADDIAQMVHTLLTVPAAEWLSGAGLDLYGGTR